MISKSELISHRVHFVGIGGAGMSGIARILLSLGADVSGSDLKDSQALAGLRKLGAKISIEHRASQVDGATYLVLSNAISSKNPEVMEAEKRGLTLLSRAQALAILMQGSRSVAVAGTHGKTTTTSMLTVALQHCGVDPSFAIGATVTNSGTSAHHGSGDIFIAEADESDGSFLAYLPHGAIVTNVELDHVDHFANLAAMESIFHQFISTIGRNGFLILCGDDAGASELVRYARAHDGAVADGVAVLTYGFDNDPHLKMDRVLIEPRSSRARVTWHGRVLGELILSIPGKHNLLNAAAALIAGLQLGCSAQELMEGLRLFSGARRRFELKGKVSQISVVDDYGHHPTEVRVTLETAKNYAPLGRVIVIFQPHRFSRTQHFAEEFARALSIADEVFLLEVYSAGEKAIPGVSSLSIAKFMDSKKARYQPSMVAVIESVVALAKPEDIIITLGAGDVSALGPLIVEALAAPH